MGGVVTKSGFSQVLLAPVPQFLTDPDLLEWCDLETIHRCLCNPGHGLTPFTREVSR